MKNLGSSKLNHQTSSRKQKVAPYSKLAYIYDFVMAHVDYQMWGGYILKFIEQWFPQATTILDIACGTGSMLKSIKAKNYDVIGMDLSLDMVKIAASKNAKSGKCFFFQGDMTAFSLKKKVDIVVCLYDSVNYLLDIQKWQSMFDCVYHCLNPNGLFIFDICTEKNSVKYFENYNEADGNNDFEYLRESTYDKKSKIHINKFTIDFNNSQTYTEYHRQRIYSIKQVRALISKTAFRLIGKFDGFSFRDASEDSLRVHFVLQKQSL